ncbi:MAG: hypothetical protein GKS05_02140 [Nitrospirales bacterium]|nr:hypothetical protein [Nitrospirales bacterium]
MALVHVGCADRRDTVVSIAIHPKKSNILYIATDESVYKTRDGGQSWIRLDEGLDRVRVTTVLVDPHLPANVLAGTMGDGVYMSPDGGHRWFSRNTGIQKGTISVNVQQLVLHPRNSQILYAATTVGVFQSTNGGAQWVERMQGMTEINFIVSLAVDPTRTNIVYAGTSGGVYRSMDATEHWEKVNTGLVPPDAKMASMALGVNILVIDPVTPDTVYAATTRGVFKTINRGETWKGLGTVGSKGYVSSMAIDPRNPNILYIATAEGVQKSVDGGNTWVFMNKGLDNINIRAIRLHPQDDHVLYIGTNGGGAYHSANGGMDWSKIPIHAD